MRYQSAMVLSTLAVGQAVAHGAHGHAHAHRRHEVKRGAADVDWDSVARDLQDVNWETDVDWSKVDFGNGVGGAASSAAPAAAPAPTPAASQPEVVATAASYETPTESSAPASEASSEPAASPSASPEPENPIEEIIGDIFSGIQEFATKLGVKTLGVNSETANNQVWIGGDSKYSATFTNSAGKDAMVWCWGKNTMWINDNQPIISIKLKDGESQKLSIGDGFSGGCGASFDDSDLFMGLLNESILEFTAGAGANGCFDISREINMKGIVLTAKGSKCTSGKDGNAQSCTFVCTDPSAQRCGDGGGDYAIEVGTSTDGPCMVGKDPFTGDAAGGCQMGDDGEHMEVTIHGSRDW